LFYAADRSWPKVPIRRNNYRGSGVSKQLFARFDFQRNEGQEQATVEAVPKRPSHLKNSNIFQQAAPSKNA
jgi:hypothetical protein